MKEVFRNPGGAVVTDDETAQVGLLSRHLFPVPTRPVGNARRSHMHGTIVQAMPHFNTDGFITMGRTRIYVGDVAMCDLRLPGAAEPRQVPCRVVRCYFEEETRELVSVVRCFRDAREVLGASSTRVQTSKGMGWCVCGRRLAKRRRWFCVGCSKFLTVLRYSRRMRWTMAHTFGPGQEMGYGARVGRLSAQDPSSTDGVVDSLGCPSVQPGMEASRGGRGRLPGHARPGRTS